MLAVGGQSPASLILSPFSPAPPQESPSPPSFLTSCLGDRLLRPGGGGKSLIPKILALQAAVWQEWAPHPIPSPFYGGAPPSSLERKQQWALRPLSVSLTPLQPTPPRREGVGLLRIRAACLGTERGCSWGHKSPGEEGDGKGYQLVRRVLELLGLVPSLRRVLTSAGVCGHWLLSVGLSVEVQCGEHPSFWPPSRGKGGSLSWPSQAAALDSALGLVPTPVSLNSPFSPHLHSGLTCLPAAVEQGWGGVGSMPSPPLPGVEGVPAHSWDVGEQTCPP